MDGGLKSLCVGRVCGADGAVARHHPHPDDGHMYPKHVELRIYQ